MKNDEEQEDEANSLVEEKSESVTSHEVADYDETSGAIVKSADVARTTRTQLRKMGIELDTPTHTIRLVSLSMQK